MESVEREDAEQSGQRPETIGANARDAEPARLRASKADRVRANARDAETVRTRGLKTEPARTDDEKAPATGDDADIDPRDAGDNAPDDAGAKPDSKRTRADPVAEDNDIGARADATRSDAHRAEDDGRRTDRPLRIAVIVPPMLPVPPPMYSGTERVVATLVDELVRRGHAVTLFASGDSQTSATLVPTIERSLWSTGYRGDISSHMMVGFARLWRDAEAFDLIHSHAETLGFLMARHCATPMLTTLHGRLDVSGIPGLIDEFSDIPLVSISESQRRWAPDANWVATIHHGLPLEAMPYGEGGEELAFVGRITPEKGVAEAIELARRVGARLRIAAKVYDTAEQAYFDRAVAPAIAEHVVEFLGELPPLERDPVFAAARATVMLGAWPEPFGLVAIESMATGTPVIARRAGALTETIEHGIDGFLVDDLDEAALAFERVGDLDRVRIRERAIERFSPERMADEYEAVYGSLLARTSRGPGGSNAR